MDLGEWCVGQEEEPKSEASLHQWPKPRHRDTVFKESSHLYKQWLSAILLLS